MRVDANNLDELRLNCTKPELLQRLEEIVLSSGIDLEAYLITSSTLNMIGYALKGSTPETLDHNTVVVLGPQKHNVSLYVNLGVVPEDFLDTYRNQFTKSQMGKSCIRYTQIKNIDSDIVHNIIKKAVSYL